MELIILLQFIDFGIIQVNRIYVLRKLCLIVIQHSRRIHLQTVVINRNLNCRRIEIAAVQTGVRDYFADRLRWKLIGIVPVKAFDHSAPVDMAQNKLIGLLYLLLDCSMTGSEKSIESILD